MGKFTGHSITSDSALGSAVIERSLRFNRGDSPYLSRALGSPTSDDKASVSVWLKRTDPGTGNSYFDNYQGTNDRLTISLLDSTDGDALSVYQRDSSGIVCLLTTTQKFRDLSAWYHILVAFDTTQGTAADRVKIYVNGTQVTSFSSSTYFSQNHNLRAGSGYTTNVGRYGAGSNYFGGYLAEFNYIDGQQLSPTDVGFTDSQTGIWMPRRYEGVYGNNGFYLDFLDNSSTATLGIDKSPNGNDFTSNNFSVAAGAGNDSVTDTPTNNFPTLNPLFINMSETAGTFSEGNLKLVTTGSEYGTALSTFSIRYGKYYWEVKQLGGSYATHGIVRGSTPNADVFVGYDPRGNLFGFGYNQGGNIKGASGTGTTSNGQLTTGLATFTTNDIIGFASDISKGTLAIYKNNTLIYTITGINDDDWIPAISGYTSDGSYSINFGQQPFSYTPPTGYRSLNSKNLPPNVSSVIRPKKHFDVLTWTGDGTATRSISGLEFKPDFVWIKNRSQTDWHIWGDSVRGFPQTMYSNRQEAEINGAASGEHGHIASAHNNGFIVKDDDGTVGGNCNANSENYVAWCWKAGGNSHTYNIDGKGYATAAAAGLDGGTIDPTGASINTESGFSILTYTGNGTAGATIAHGLGKKPAWIIIKCRSNTDNWMVYHQKSNIGDGGNSEDYYLELNARGGTVNSNIMLNDTAPTSTLVTIENDNSVNGSSRTYVMYCWAEIPGFSKFGDYRANDSNYTGPYIHTGFKPAWVMAKGISLSWQDWCIFDDKRKSFSGSGNRIDGKLGANEDIAEAQDDYNVVDFLSNGWRVSGRSASDINYGSGYPKQLYMAFAEEPDTTPFDTFPNAR